MVLSLHSVVTWLLPNSLFSGIFLAKLKKPELMCEGYLVKGGGPLVVFRAVTRLVVLGGSREEAGG